VALLRKEKAIDKTVPPVLLAENSSLGLIPGRSKQGRLQLGHRRFDMPIYSSLLESGSHESAKKSEPTI
jgi:hypothetical protein